MADLPPQHPTTIENIPGELLSEILIRVPAKPLARMRSVSKPWNHLLSQPSFIKYHLHLSLHNKKDEILLVLLSGNYDDLFSITTHSSQSPRLELPDFIKPPAIPPSANDNLTFFGSVNGLICYGFRTPSDFIIQIWNPSLSAVLTLPPFNALDGFIFNDSTYELHFRFGYDPKTDDYKLVKLMSFTLPPVNDPGMTYFVQAKRCFTRVVNDVEEVEVYSMRNGSWKLIENRLPLHVREIVDEEVVCVDGQDGILHWFGIVSENGWLSMQTIVTFDLSVESFGEICLPNSVIGRYWDGLGVYGGKLCVMSFNKRRDCEVWVMDDYGVAESWTKIRMFSDFGDDKDPYGFTSSNKFLFSVYWSETDYDHLKIYEPGTEKVESFKTMARERYCTKIVRYVESLVWVAPAN
ncbi:hypothetical protein OSB04_017972 [Centaurea solstitialis]|uniref:F-box domain-containing protein n=1 Tax=Centaurea solstitialis TaxID=347529 RepID=A0AA38WA00_9ASTR|nr:hypothetical protein OSB04_017972 [Centaurea solstitialis]